MYKQSVVNLSVCKYVKASPELLSKVFDPEFKYSSHGGQEWVCKTCHAALTCGKMPTQAIANGLKLSSIPPELSCLNSLELRLISLRLPFMKMVALPSGKQRCIHGPAVNVPSKLDNVCTVLPRLPSQSELVALKLKRKLSYKGHYMYDYVTPEKVLNALKWLKEHNPLYVDVEVDEEWSLHAETDDHDLYSSITAITDCSDTMAANSECTNLVNTSTDSSNIVSFDAGPSITNIESAISLNSELCNNSSMCDQEPTVNPTECLNISEHCDNNLVTAKHHLEQYASENDFSIHDVPGDGNCLYHAILYQLEQNNVISATVHDIRELVACYLEDHKEMFMPFVSSPIAPDNVINSDTEIPSAVDASIASVTDPDTRSALVYARYVDRVRNGSWGDHVVIAAIANMYHVSVNVVQARQSGCTVSITSPVNDHSNCEINLGLLMQYHFVGLDKLVVHVTQNENVNVGSHSVPNNQSLSHNPSPLPMSLSEQDTEHIDNTTHATTSDASSNSPFINNDHNKESFEDDAIEEGDEYTRQITGGPLASMMTIENPETFNEVVCVAPAEGQTPLFIMTDPNFEAMSNPEKFPISSGCFTTERPNKITYRKYFNQRLLNVDGRFAKDTDYLFVAQYIVEAKQILDDAHNFIWRQKPGRNFTAQQARDKNIVSQCVRKDKAYSFMKNLRGSPAYYQKTFYELLAMIRQLGTPTWFFTLSAADMKWPDVIQTIARQYGVTYTDEQVAALSFEDKANWIRRNPVTAARHYQYRLNTFFHDFLKSSANPLGELVEYAIRIEFQARGSPHAHCLLWIKDAPKYGVDSNASVCQFIDQYITCEIPDKDSKLKDMVLLLQQHKHSNYCKRNRRCRFNFPHPPSNETIISEPSETASDYTDILTSVYKALAENPNDSMSELLNKSNVTLDQYVTALQVSTKSSVVILKRKPNECNINNYNASVILAWQANMDIQYVLNAYACVMYVASYIQKDPWENY